MVIKKENKTVIYIAFYFDAVSKKLGIMEGIPHLILQHDMMMTLDQKKNMVVKPDSAKNVLNGCEDFCECGNTFNYINNMGIIFLTIDKTKELDETKAELQRTKEQLRDLTAKLENQEKKVSGKSNSTK